MQKKCVTNICKASFSLKDADRFCPVLTVCKLVRLEPFKMDLQELRSHVIDIKLHEVILQSNRVKFIITPCPSSSLVSSFCTPFVVFDILTALIDLSLFSIRYTRADKRKCTSKQAPPAQFFSSHAKTVQPA